jgi:hypothetical protein
MVRILLSLAAAAVLGVSLGAGMAWWRLVTGGWDAASDMPETWLAALQDMPPGTPAPEVVLDEEEHDFGVMMLDDHREHTFVVRNVGKAPLRLRPRGTSCRCTVSGIERDQVPAGESTRITLRWTADGKTGPYRQTAAFQTNDPKRRRIVLTVVGHVTAPVKVVPPQLVLPNISASEPTTATVRVFGYVPEPLAIQLMSPPEQPDADRFDIAVEPLAGDQMREEPYARSGFAVRITVKPGLPQGPFQQTIQLRTNMHSHPMLAIPIQGVVASDLSIVGRGWRAEDGVLVLGTVSNQMETTRRLVVVARGPYRQQVNFKAVEKVPPWLVVEIGEPTPIADGAAVQTSLTIKIPKDAPSVNHLGSEYGGYGHILLETNHPKAPSLRILLCFAVQE